MKLKVLLVTHYYSSHGGGVEMVAGQIARRLTDRDTASIEWCAADCDDPPTDMSRATFTPLRACNFTEEKFGLPYPLPAPSAVRMLYRRVKSADFVHVHDCQYPTSILASLFARAQRKPVLVTQHVGLVPYRSAVLRSMMQVLNRVGGALVLSRATAVRFVSPHVLRYFSSFVSFGQRAGVAENGLDTSLFQRRPDCVTACRERPCLLFVGRFVEKKGLWLIRALAAKKPEWDFVIVGEGPIDPIAWKLDNVKVLGNRKQEDLVGLYRDATVLLLPSVGEGFPLVVQEALACGCVVAVSDEVASSGALPPEVALSAPVRSGAEEEWCSLLESFMQESEEQRERRRATAADYAARRWSWERCADEYGHIFMSAVVPAKRDHRR